MILSLDVLSEVSNHIASAYNAVRAKGGTIPVAQDLRHLSESVNSIPDTPPTPGEGTEWGKLTYYPVYWIEYSADYIENCTVTDIDGEKLEYYLSLQEDEGTINFSYDEDYDPETGEPTGDFYWYYVSDFDRENPIRTEDMPSVTGITVTIDDPDMPYAYFDVQQTIEVDKEVAPVDVALTETEFGKLVGSVYSVHGENIPREAVKAFEFGTEPTSTPSGFLSNSQIESIDFTYASSLTTIGHGFMTDIRSLLYPVVLPNTVTSIGNNFLLSGSINQSISIPNSVTSIGSSFMASCTAFNQPFSLPSSLVSLGTDFMFDCGNMTSTINLQNIPANVAMVSSRSFATSFTNSPAYVTGIHITGTYASDWSSRFPNVDNHAPYRKIVIV